MTGFSAGLQSGTILLREGLEALLVVAALTAFVKRAGVSEKVRPIYLGAALAVFGELRGGSSVRVVL
jgi:high-affinity iron transporter